MRVRRDGSAESQEQAGAEAAPSSGVQPARGRHCVFVTQNTEYHCRGHVCIAVRDRRTGCWLPDHPARNVPVISGLYFEADSGLQLRPPEIGEPLIFYTNEARRLVTSPVQSVALPEEEAFPDAPGRR